MDDKEHICPRCKEGIVQSNNTGIVEIYFWKDPTCKSLEEFKKKFGQKERAMRKFEFHYKKCNQCDYVILYEYREIPYWNENIDYTNYPFIEGDIIKNWKYGANSNVYIGSKVIQW